jgi:hypothetical protein
VSPAIAAERALVLLPFPSNYNRCSGDINRTSAWLPKADQQWSSPDASQVSVAALLDPRSQCGTVIGSGVLFADPILFSSGNVGDEA